MDKVMAEPTHIELMSAAESASAVLLDLQEKTASIPMRLLVSIICRPEASRYVLDTP